MFGDLIHRINEQLDNEEFSSDVSISVQKPLLGDAFINEAFKTRIIWKLDIEARSWGIKDINIFVTKDVQIAWIEVDGDDHEKEQTATLPAGLITIGMESKGSGIFPIELEVKLDQHNKPISAILPVAFPSAR